MLELGWDSSKSGIGVDAIEEDAHDRPAFWPASMMLSSVSSRLSIAPKIYV